MKAKLQFHTFESSHQNKIRTLTRFFKTMNFVDKVVDENSEGGMNHFIDEC